MKTKTAVRGGHNFQATGANGHLNEVVEDRKVKDAVIKYLKQLGHEVLDVTPSNMASGADLKFGTSKANNWGADLFVSIHFNSAVNKDAKGTEVLVYSKFDTAQRVVNKIAGLGFTNRGLKVEGNKWHELRETNMSAMIVEVCFVSNKADSDKYKSVGYDAIGKAIAEGIANKTINTTTPVEPPKPPVTAPTTPNKPNTTPQKKLWELSIQGEEVKALQKVLGVKVDGYFGDDTLKACPVLRKGSKGSVVKVMQKRLINRGYNMKPYNDDSDFGVTTEKAVKRLQDCFRLTQDGIVGKNTWKALYGLDKGRF